MPKLIPTVSVGISRKIGSRNVTTFPKIGEMFDFTDEEVEQIKAAHPNGLRKPINEETTAATMAASQSAARTGNTEVTSEEREDNPPVTGNPPRPGITRRQGVRRTNEDEDL